MHYTTFSDSVTDSPAFSTHISITNNLHLIICQFPQFTIKTISHFLCRLETFTNRLLPCTTPKGALFVCWTLNLPSSCCLLWSRLTIGWWPTQATLPLTWCYQCDIVVTELTTTRSSLFTNSPNYKMAPKLWRKVVTDVEEVLFKRDRDRALTKIVKKKKIVDASPHAIVQNRLSVILCHFNIIPWHQGRSFATILWHFRVLQEHITVNRLFTEFSVNNAKYVSIN